MYSSKCENSIKTFGEHDNVDETEGKERKEASPHSNGAFQRRNKPKIKYES